MTEPTTDRRRSEVDLANDEIARVEALSQRMFQKLQRLDRSGDVDAETLAKLHAESTSIQRQMTEAYDAHRAAVSREIDRADLERKADRAATLARRRRRLRPLLLPIAVALPGIALQLTLGTTFILSSAVKDWLPAAWLLASAALFAWLLVIGVEAPSLFRRLLLTTLAAGFLSAIFLFGFVGIAAAYTWAFGGATSTVGAVEIVRDMTRSERRSCSSGVRVRVQSMAGTVCLEGGGRDAFADRQPVEVRGRVSSLGLLVDGANARSK